MKLFLPEVKESPEVLASMLTALEDLATSNRLAEAHYYKAVVIIAGRFAAIGHTTTALSTIRERIPVAYTMGDMIGQILEDADFHRVVVALSNAFIRKGEARAMLGELRPTQGLAKA